MKKLHRLLCVLPILSASVYAQEKPINIEVEAQAIGTTNDVVPFWMRSNQYGSIPSAGASGSLIGRINKDYDREQPKKFDWGFGFEGRGNAGKDSRFILIEGYAKAKAGIFQLKAGRTKDVMGLNGDTTLSSGNFAVSGNALGIPKIEISIPEYWRVPIFDGLFSIKGNFSHGWVGHTTIIDSTLNSNNLRDLQLVKSYFHSKSLYVRLAKRNWKLSFYGGFNHNVFWGAEKNLYGDMYSLSPIETFFYVVTGKTYGTQKLPSSKLGNQLGSVDIGVEYQLDNYQLMLYRQFFYDTGALSKLANIEDGLTGLVIKNRKSSSEFHLKKILLEFFYSKNQAGESWSPKTKSGDEDYYNNYLYRQGWSYYDQNLGNPLITSYLNGREDLPRDPNQYFLNNRVVALHLGVETGIGNSYEFAGKVSVSKNYGTFLTSEQGNDAPRGDEFIPQYGIFRKTGQLSVWFYASKKFSKSMKANISTSFDYGKVLHNSMGFNIGIIKSL